MIKLISHKTILKVNGITLEALERQRNERDIKHISIPLSQIQETYVARKAVWEKEKVWKILR